jgi:TRAP-type mannitol/chloroaromatic compound transport system substrate-binding protein
MESLTEYDQKHPAAVAELVSKHGVVVREAPRDLLVAFGNAAGEVLAEIRGDSDPLVKRIAESYVAFRNLQAEYTTQAYNGVMNARRLPIKWG